jgi:excisionase family DNA binding protein
VNCLETERELLKVRRVAAVTDTSTTTVRRWIDRGELPIVRIAGSVRIRREDLDNFIRERLERPEAA